MEQINGKGNLLYEANTRMRVSIHTTGEFHLLLNDRIVAPNNANDRFAQKELNVNDRLELVMETENRYSMVIKELPNRGEVVSSESMVEIIPEEEMSMYDRLRADMLGAISKFAEAKGMDNYENDNDFEMEEEENLINTPYEYQAMVDEYPIEPEEPEPEKEPEKQEDTDTEVSV